jgi:hypothetical protein
MIWQLAGSAETPELKALGAPAVTAYTTPPNAPQPNTTDKLETWEGRLMQAVAAADPGAGGAEAVWTQHTVAGGAGTVVRWYELLPGKLEVKQSGTISDLSLFVFNAAIAPTLSGGAVIDYDTANASSLVQIVAQSRLGSDPAGTMSGPVTLASSAAIDSDFTCPSHEPKNTGCRWGDYAGASVDPNNPNVVWGANQVDGPVGKEPKEHEAQWATQIFALTPPAAPTVETKAATAVTQTSATLNASVNPNGVQVSECKLEYGPTTSYGQSAPCTPPPGMGTSEVAVSAALESLAEGATYHFRVSATNAGGPSFGSDLTFTTTLALGPHWYQNGTRLGETTPEEGVPIIVWGLLTLESTKPAGTFTCQTLAGGDISNAVGGGAGKGALEAVTFYNCMEPTCEAAKGLLEVIPEKPEWSSVLIEESGLRDRIEGIALREICVGGATNVEFHGLLKPQVEAGAIIGAGPAHLAFGAAAGSLQSAEGVGNVSGKLKLMGFEGGEVISGKT